MIIMLSGKWYKVPSALLNDELMTRADIMVYAYIADALKGKTAALRTSTIAERCELSRRQVLRSIAKLEERSCIAVDRSDGRSSRYTDLLLRQSASAASVDKYAEAAALDMQQLKGVS